MAQTEGLLRRAMRRSSDFKPFYFVLNLLALIRIHLPSAATDPLKGCRDLMPKKTDTTLVDQKYATENLLAYLQDLLENQLISGQDLSAFYQNLLNAKLVNPISKKTASAEAIYQLHQENIEDLLIPNALDFDLLKSTLEEMLKIESRVRQDKSEKAGLTIEVFNLPKFLPLKPHPLPLMGKWPDGSPPVKHAFEMTSTPITQGQWYKVMGTNPSHFTSGEDSIVLKMSGKATPIRPDAPVENMSWWEALEFANKLSLQEGLKPVYDLSKVHQQAEEERKTSGTDLNLVRIPKGFLEEDIHKTEGYRLPTNAEMIIINEKLVLAGYPTSNRKGVATETRAHFAHVSEEGSVLQTTAPVGLLKPFELDGQKFYDLFGNVRFWTSTPFMEQGFLMVFGTPHNLSRLSSEFILKCEAVFEHPGARSRFTGLILVRTL